MKNKKSKKLKYPYALVHTQDFSILAALKSEKVPSKLTARLFNNGFLLDDLYVFKVAEKLPSNKELACSSESGEGYDALDYIDEQHLDEFGNIVLPCGTILEAPAGRRPQVKKSFVPRKPDFILKAYNTKTKVGYKVGAGWRSDDSVEGSFTFTLDPYVNLSGSDPHLKLKVFPNDYKDIEN